MPYIEVVSGDYITASWANTYAMKQVVVPYSSTTDRTNNGPTVPTTGMLSVLTTNSTTEGLYEYTSAGSWRRPWNMPWGIVGSSTVSSDQSLSSTSIADITGLSANPVEFVANRYYRATLSMYVTGNVSAGNRFATLQLWNGGNSTQFASFGQQAVQVSDNLVYCATATFTTSAVTGTVKVRYALSGTDAIKVKGGTGSSSVSELVIEDLGPAGAPS